MGDSRGSKAGAVIAVLLLSAVSLSADITVSSITPASGLTRGGEIVHIHGTNLLGPALACPSIACGPYVKFGDAFGTLLDDTASEIVVIAPAHAAGRVDLQVNVPANPAITLPSAYAYEDPSGDVRLLLPIVISAAGASGTNWQTEIVAHNENTEPLPIAGQTIPPFGSAVITLTPPAGSAGTFISIPKRLADNVSVNARVHDTTRDSDSWGAEVPAVPETQFRRSVILLSVPTDARYRALLRVYGYTTNDTNFSSTTAAFRDDATGEFLGVRTLLLQSGYAQIPIDAFAGVHPRLRVQVTAELSLIWAFVSITNNTTQQVTTITPALTANAVALSGTLTPGHWGANGICATVTNTDVSITNGCAFGSFPTPAVGADGHFEADGTLVSGGAAPPPGPPPPAHFSGVVQGTSMTVMARSGSTTYGPWTVRVGDTTPCGPFCP